MIANVIWFKTSKKKSVSRDNSGRYFHYLEGEATLARILALGSLGRKRKAGLEGGAKHTAKLSESC